MFELTDEQQLAVYASHQRVLVSASAGTGKTHVLTQRYLRLVMSEGVEVRQILAVTFTEAAAAEMRSRIALSLRHHLRASAPQANSDWLYRQLLQLERAPICTLHSFCLRVVREFFNLLGLDPDFAILDPAEAEVLKRDALEETLEAWFEKRPENVSDEAFYRFVDEYGGLLAGEHLYRMLLELDAFIETLPDPEAWWDDVQMLYHHPDPQNPQSERLRQLWQIIPQDEHGRAMEELRGLAPLVAVMRALHKSFAHSYWQRKLARAQLDFADLERLTLRLLREHPHVRAQLHRRFRHILVDEYQDVNQLQNTILEMLASAGAHSQLFMVGDDKQSIYGFRLACPALFQEKVVRYRWLTPDYAQASANLSALADPGLTSSFAGHEPSGLCIPLTKNFRSRRTILEAVNTIFTRIAQSNTFGMCYDNRVKLVFAAPTYDALNDAAAEEEPVTLHVLPNLNAESAKEDAEEGSLEPQLGVSSERLECEAKLAARLIRQWVGQRLVWDAEQGSFRHAEYRDVAILMRTVQGRASAVVQVLRRSDIPVHAELRRGFWDALEIRDMAALLQLLRNPLDDVPLAAVLRSPLVGLGVDDLARIRLAQREGPFYFALHRYREQYGETELGSKIANFLKLLADWRERVRQQPIARLLWDIYRETGYLAFAKALPDGEARAANLVRLHDLARQFEKSTRGDLDRFLHYLERLRENEQDFGPAAVVSPAENVVRLMSIHQSKGLEFPMVILLDLGSQFNEESLNRPFLYDHAYLLSMKQQDERGIFCWPTTLYQLSRQKLRGALLAEELRLLYVAMTRAREGLALIGTHNRLTQPKNSEDSCDEEIPAPAKIRSPLQWLLPVFRWAQRQAVPVLRLQEWKYPELASDRACHPDTLPPDQSATELAGGLQPGASSFMAASGAAEEHETTQRELLRRLNWQYPHDLATCLPGKTSPTELRLWLEQDQDTAHMARWEFRRHAADRPGFLAATSSGFPAAERGRLTHRFLRHIELSRPVDDVDELRRQLTGLLQQNVFTANEAEAVDVQAIANFFRRPLGQRLRRARQVLRELPFSLMLPATELPEAAIFQHHHERMLAWEHLNSESILVQGVIDLLFWEKSGNGPILVDFKTDNLTPKELPEARQRYAPQLALYARAVSEALQPPCCEVWLVFLTIEQDALLDQETLASCLRPLAPSS